MIHKRFQVSSIGELTFFLGLQVQQKEDGIFISQDKYVADILKKFDFTTIKATSTPIETNKALNKDEEAKDVDVHLYRSMIGSLMYLTASRPDIMFAVYACERFQVTPKTSHLHAVKRIFRYLKGQPKLGLWYPRDSPFDLEAFSDSDYAGASLDRKSTTGGCQFLGKRLISWQCKKQTIVANSTTEAEYVAAANCSANLTVQKEQEEQAAQRFTLYWNFPIINDDDDEYTIQYREYLENLSNAITPYLSTEEPDNSLSMGDEHLDTILETESDKVIKSSVEDLVPIPSESEGIFNMCDVPSCDKKHFDAESDLMESLLNSDTPIVYSPKIDSLLEKFAGELVPINPIPPGIHEADFDPKEDICLDDQMFYDDTSSDDDSFEDIDYVEASPPDSELISLEEVKDFDTKDGEIDTDILLTIKDDILCEKLRNINLHITKIESLNDNPTPDFVLKSSSSFPILVKDSDFFLEKSKTFLSLPKLETFKFDIEEKNSGSITVHAENSLPEYDSFHFEIESDQGELSRVVMETIDEIDTFLDIDISTNLEDGYHDSEGDIIYLESLLINNTIPNLSPEDCPDFKDSRARCFFHRSLALQSLACLY
ncbi:uncharacterized mitochondrial protein-like protein [Tanacetum coccineum]